MPVAELIPAPEGLSEEMAEAFPPPAADLRACFVFSMPKCGSTMLTKATESVMKDMGLPGFHFSRFFWPKGDRKSSWTNYDLRAHVKDGYVYFGFRSVPDFVARAPLLQQRPSIFLVRDPRDAATSHYFSKLYEHPVPGNGTGPAAEKFLREREELAKTEIDDHVVKYANAYLHNWQSYIDVLPLASGLARIYRYEDIVFSKRAFLEEAFGFLGIPATPASLDAAARKVDVFPETEQVDRRVRSVTPGDHRRKLKPETIETMNRLLDAPLRYHGYL